MDDERPAGVDIDAIYTFRPSMVNSFSQEFSGRRGACASGGSWKTALPPALSEPATGDRRTGDRRLLYD